MIENSSLGIAILVSSTNEGFTDISRYYINITIDKRSDVYVLNPAHVPLSWANSPTLGTYYRSRLR